MTICPAQNLLQSNGLTVHISEIKPQNAPRSSVKPIKYPFIKPKNKLYFLTNFQFPNANLQMESKITEHPITIANKTKVANFSILTAPLRLTPKNLTAIDPERIALAALISENISIIVINHLIQDYCRQGKNQPSRPAPEYEKLLIPTPGTWDNPDQLPPLEQEI